MFDDSFSLFDAEMPVKPLAERLRPDSLDDFVGQEAVVGEGTLLRRMIEEKNLSSFILWGPPGVGKTTLAKIISRSTNTLWQSFSAVLTGIKEVKHIMEEARHTLRVTGKKTVIFIDEIHRFNKAQQDAFLAYVEDGTIILIGATTENPSFSIINPLLSRMRVISLKRLKDEHIMTLAKKAIAYLKEHDGIEIIVDEAELAGMVKVSSGDARRCFGLFEMALKLANNDKTVEITKEVLKKILQGRLPSYDKKGDFHFDYISALHKSLRNSDVDASIYYTVKMLDSGEDPLYVVRRLIQFSSEDVGLADPQALTLAIAARDTVMALGMPEAILAIIEAVIYNALAPKSNSTYEAYNRVREDIKRFPDLPVPMQIRNAPTKLMQEEGYGMGYEYAHDNTVPITAMQCLPDELKDRRYYVPKEFGFEKKLKDRHEKIKDIKNKMK